MDANTIHSILKNYVSDSQAKKLSKIISKYEEAQEVLYNTIGVLEAGIPFNKVLAEVDSENIYWNSCVFDEYKRQREIKDGILAKPPEIREGEIECPKCHMKKTLVVEMQTRSADEGFTYSIHCYNSKCKAVTK